MMVDLPSYVILGNGRWAAVIRDVLSKEDRSVVSFKETRRRANESEELFKKRVSGELTCLSSAQIAWLCIPPCNEIPWLIESAIRAGLHVIVEKPWLCSREQTEALIECSVSHQVLVAVHFQYCFLDKVEELRVHLPISSRHRLSGTFTIRRENRLGIPALENLGSHLFAVRECAAPLSEVRSIRCGYDSSDERRVLIETETGPVHELELVTGEPLIQRFSRSFERAIPLLKFQHDLAFAMRVSESISSFKASRSTCIDC